MGLYVIGIDLNLSGHLYTFIGQSFITNLVLYFFSVKFKMCGWHRVLIINMTSCLLLETLYNFKVIRWDYSYSVIVLTIFASLIAISWNKIKKIKKNFRAF